MLFRRSMLIAGVMRTTWRFNPADKATNANLSNNDRTLTQSSGGVLGVRGTVSKNSGKWYTENRCGGSPGSSSFGLATSGHSLSAEVGSGTGAGYSNGGAVVVNGSNVTTLSSSVSGDIIGIAVNFTLLRVWFSKNGVWMSGDPAAGTGGYAFTAGTYFPMATATSIGGWTIPESLAYSPPSGFGAF